MTEEVSPNDIAIIGLALRVPGARNAQEFWKNLRAGIRSIERRAPEQLIAAGESPEKLRRKNYVPYTAEMPGMADFDADFFGFSPKDAAIMDPQHRHFLECVWEALEDAARPPERAVGPVGVFAGCGMGSYFYFNLCSNRQLVDQVGMFLLRHTGNDKDFLSTRVSYLLDLHGPSVNVQTACSTSLVAVHYAAQSLLNGECDMAIAGGVTIELPHGRGYLFQEGEILSPDGHCRAFDHRAAGTVFGSGAGVVVLRRLADALADGDPVRAVIKATAINNDGAGKASYLAPSVTGQAEAIVEAQALAGVAPDTIQYVECHGTGTSLGDPIEIAALTQAFRVGTDKTGFCRVGSVKSNIGHLDTAAGVVSLIKATLAIEQGEIPPSLGYEAPNPAIDFDSSPFKVADKLYRWPEIAGPRRAAVNSLGVGGTNAHAVIEQAPPRARPVGQATSGPQILALSARNRNAVNEAAQRLASFMEATPHLRLEDVAHTLIDGRRRFDHRLVVAAADREDAIGALRRLEAGRCAYQMPVEGASSAVLLFPGGGAQYPKMGQALYAGETVFAEAVDEGLSYLRPDLASRIRDLWLGSSLSASDAAHDLLQPSLQLPAILIIEVALARLWQSAGLRPTALIGHSMGEYAAACIAGIMTFERAVRLVQLRGQLFDEIADGGMLSVQLAHDELRACLPDTLDIAVVNAPELCVVSGPKADLELFRQTLDARGISATTVPINIAAHSRMLDPILSRFEAFLRETPLAPPVIPVVSNLTGTWMTPEEATDPLYWVRHLRSTVRFADGLATLAADKTRVFIEAGPGRMLSSLAKAQGHIEANAVINSLPHADEPLDDRLYFLTAVGRAWAAGLDLPVNATSADATPRRVRLPTYAFQHQRYFFDRITSESREMHSEMPHKIPDIEDWGWVPAWKAAYPDFAIGADSRPCRFLVFVDDAGAGGEMVSRLRASGHHVTTVELGDAFGVKPDGNYVLCPELGRAGYDALLQHLAGNGGIPERVVHLWLLTADEQFRPGSSFFHRNQERGFYSLFFLAQAIGEHDPAQAIQINVLTNGMQRLGDEKLRYPDKATILGPAQVIPRELPHTQVRVIDLPFSPNANAASLLQRGRMAFSGRTAATVDTTAAKKTVQMVWDDLFADAASEIVAYRDGRRWVKTYRKVQLKEAGSGQSKFREHGVYMITGGLGDLAVACARDLATSFRARIALVGRLKLPDPALWTDYLTSRGETTRVGRAIAAIRSIEAAGGEVMYLRADITNIEDVQAAVESIKARFGALNGILHAAGVVNDDLIQLKSVADMENVLAPKILGTKVLENLMNTEPLDLVVLFSSTSTDIAPAGQVDYVAANSYLNAVADSLNDADKPRVVAVHWGVWNEVGLAARAIREADVPPQAIEVASQPLFEDRIDMVGASGRLEFRASPGRHWLLSEHRLKSGEAIWPGTGYLELVAEATREFGVQGAIEVKDLTFLRPLYVADDAERHVRVVVNREAKALRIAVESQVTSGSDHGWLRHAEATAAMTRELRPATIDISRELARCNRVSKGEQGRALDFAQAVHLKTGRRWDVLREVHIGADRAVARLQLDSAFADDLKRGLLMHPALTDVATGFAMELIPGYDPAAGLWVPANYGRVRLYGAMPATVWSVAVLSDENDPASGFATFDLKIADEAGQIVAAIESFTVRKLDANTDFSSSLRDTAGSVEVVQRDLPARELSPAMMRLALQVDQGILPSEGGEALRRAVAVGYPQIIVSSMDLALLQQAAGHRDERVSESAMLARPETGSDFVAPRTDVEKTLAGFWSELLGINRVGITDSFFDLGGHSLVAVRLFRMIKKAYAVDFPISVLFEAPTIEKCAQLIESSGAATATSDASKADEQDGLQEKRHFSHLVPMDAGRDRDATPLFICAGMFGNILNLRHLALHIGQDRPVYGLQARGLYGGEAPHETFEDMATSYLEEVRAVQPQGPYLFAGFSGGGLVAYEMAQILKRSGESVDLLIMLDTPYPERADLSIVDKLTMKLQDLRRDKGAFLAQWARRRLVWELERIRKSRETTEYSSEQFHNRDIEAAFRRALWSYKAQPYDGPVLLLRPRLQFAYRLLDGRLLHADRNIVQPDNGWSPYLQHLIIKEVPGDHDSMVLEPHVRLLAKYMRDALNMAGFEQGLLAAE